MLSDLLEKTTTKYTCELPVSGKKVRFRPFFVREEKILLLAMQEKSSIALANGMSQIIQNCCEDMEDPYSLSFSDAIYLFLKIRSKSVGETIESTIIENDMEIPIEFDLDQGIQIEGSKQDSKINLAKNLIVQMREPLLSDYAEIEFDDNFNGHYMLIAKCIKSVITEEEQINTSTLPDEEVLDFVEKLSKNQFEKIVKFIANSPKVFLQANYILDGERKNLKIESIFDFFAFPSVT